MGIKQELSLSFNCSDTTTYHRRNKLRKDNLWGIYDKYLDYNIMIFLMVFFKFDLFHQNIYNFKTKIGNYKF